MREGYIKIAELLVKSSADVNVKDKVFPIICILAARTLAYSVRMIFC